MSPTIIYHEKLDITLSPFWTTVGNAQSSSTSTHSTPIMTTININCPCLNVAGKREQMFLINYPVHLDYRNELFELWPTANFAMKANGDA